MDHTSLIFRYLKEEYINIDQKEFQFQYSSHPDYPSLLAISDTLNFFNIPNGALKVNTSKIELLPDIFIAMLNINSNKKLSFVEKKRDEFAYIYNGNKIRTSKTNFEKLWGDVVLLIENDRKIRKNKFVIPSKFFLSILLLVFFILLISTTITNIWIGLFYILPFIGLYLSIIALKDIFAVNSNLVDKFCNLSKVTSCSSVVNSSKWKILERINFSDLSFTFFTTQIVALFLMGLTDNFHEYFIIQSVLLTLSIPILFLSLYYQKFVEKNWCPICLMIIALTIVEFSYVFYFKDFFSGQFENSSILLYLFSYTLVLAPWLIFKNDIKKFNQLKAFQIKANRFKRNYFLFKNTLLKEKKLELPKSPLIFGSQSAPLNINIITSPLCGYCKEPHYMLKSILEKHGQHLSVSIIYNVKPNHKSIKLLVASLFSLRKEGDKTYYKAMDYWYKNKNIEKWLSKYQTSLNQMNSEQILYEQRNWCQSHHFNFTPVLFINGYQFPKMYDISDLKYFVEELIEDSKTTKSKAETEKLLIE